MKVSLGDLDILVESNRVESPDGSESSHSDGALFRPPGGWPRKLVQLFGGRASSGDFRGSQLYDLDESFKLVFRRHSDLSRLRWSCLDVRKGQAEREMVRASGEMVLHSSFGQWHVGKGQINRVRTLSCISQFHGLG
ncbi:hypothetical protein FOC4_g10004835 [Fusarium odoratissimum]|uniref:Uncharacterized protein n=1 Tax=Fusarium oxysporum f. sp. cubense (strain race 4) TaxID=2502994 RepID=N1RTQ7_FUSC4|nr:hypothetical protein FOC4_g10004835 [Fusarium odoratissimum]